MEKMDISINAFYNCNIVSKDSFCRGIHSHDCYELYFLENGDVTYFIEGQIISVKSGEMILIPMRLMHYTNYDEKSFPAKRHTIFINDADIRDELRPCFAELLEKRHIVFSNERLHYITNIFKNMQQEEKKNFPDKNIMLKVLFEELIITARRYCKSESKANVNSIQMTIQNVSLYIKDNLTDDLKLETLATKFSISPSHLSKQFKLLTGIGLSEYINISRISASENLLLNTNLSITEIAFKCGFNDSNYFSRVFKKLKGITPKAFSMQK